MKFLKRLGLVLMVVVVVFAGVVANRPAAFHVERSLEMSAPPAAVLPHIADFRAWVNWSPWEKLDPGMKKTFGGAPSGVGATYAWKGNDDVGRGRMTFTEVAPERVVIRIEFLEPFAATNTATFLLAPAGAGTRVTWVMDGKNNFVSKAFSLFMSMDRMIGGDFEKGLSAMKVVTERTPEAPAVP